LATSPTEKRWVDIASRLIGLLTALGLVFGFAKLCDHVLTTTVSPADFVNAHLNDDADSVKATVQEVEKTVLASCDADIGHRASLHQTLFDAEGKFSKVDTSLVSPAANPPTGLESAYFDMETAVVELHDAVSTAHGFIDSQKPSDLANFSTQWTRGREQWNEAVRKIWKAAGQRPRTVDETAAAGCGSPGVG
jgi:hypothetical protein